MAIQLTQVIGKFASRSDDATVAVGFNPRNVGPSPSVRRVATIAMASLPDGTRLVFNRRYATGRISGHPNRGLKPTATIITSLCDETFGP
jgi:hypothetical protein